MCIRDSNLSVGSSWTTAGNYGVARFHGAHNGGGTRVMFSNANSTIRYGIVMHGSDTGTAHKLGIGLLLNENATYANAVPAITIDSNRNVVIGTTNPNTNLLLVYRPDGSNSGDYTVQIHNADTTSDQGHGLLIRAGNDANDIPLQVRSRTNTTFLKVNGAGNIGIGTTSPESTLQVNSTANNPVTIKSFGTNTHAGINLISSKGTAASPTDINEANYTIGD